MKRRGLAAAAGVGAAVAAAIGGALMGFGAQPSTPVAQEPAPTTAVVTRGTLSDLVSQYGTLTFRARSDGSPYAVINQARGTYTQLPAEGDTVACGDELYRVDEKPVLLLCGAVPVYRTLHSGDVGGDVRQLNQNLHALGFDAGAQLDPSSNSFTSSTQQALATLQQGKGLDVSGSLGLGAAVFLPEPVRIATVTGELGGSAQPNAMVLQATSGTPEVQLNLDPSQQGSVTSGDRAQITLPGNTSVAGTVDRIGNVVQVQAGQNGDPLAAVIPVYVTLDDPEAVRGFDAAPVQVDITTQGVADALSVPVAALVGKAGGGFAVDVLRADGRRELVAVKLGLFDTGAGRVEVQGALVQGDLVVVPAS